MGNYSCDCCGGSYLSSDHKSGCPYYGDEMASKAEELEQQLANTNKALDVAVQELEFYSGMHCGYALDKNDLKSLNEALAEIRKLQGGRE